MKIRELNQYEIVYCLENYINKSSTIINNTIYTTLDKANKITSHR